MNDDDDVNNDHAWQIVCRGQWGYGSRYGAVRSSLLPHYDIDSSAVRQAFAAYIKCTGPNTWVLYIRGAVAGELESWEEAKGLAAVLLGAQEAQ